MNYKNNQKYDICVRCVMDTSDKDIIFNDKGVCNYCLHTDKYLVAYPSSKRLRYSRAM